MKSEKIIFYTGGNMLTQIADNIYRKVVPLPNNPLREINAYIITGEKNLLIDTGFNLSLIHIFAY